MPSASRIIASTETVFRIVCFRRFASVSSATSSATRCAVIAAIAVVPSRGRSRPSATRYVCIVPSATSTRVRSHESAASETVRNNDVHHTFRQSSDFFFLTGFDEYTFQYEESVREELKSFMHHLEQMHKLSTEYLSMRVKRIKLKSYEMQARISLGKNGMVRAESEGASFHDAFKELMARLKKQATRQKEEMLTDRKNRKGVRDED